MKIKLKDGWHDSASKVGSGYYIDIDSKIHFVPNGLVAEVVDYGADPDAGAVVLDKDGDAWQRGSSGWELAGTDEYCLSWNELNDRYGPLTRVVKVPATAPSTVRLDAEGVTVEQDWLGGPRSYCTTLAYKVEGATNVKTAMRDLGAYLLHTYA